MQVPVQVTTYSVRAKCDLNGHEGAAAAAAEGASTAKGSYYCCCSCIGGDGETSVLVWRQWHWRLGAIGRGSCGRKATRTARRPRAPDANWKPVQKRQRRNEPLPAGSKGRQTDRRTDRRAQAESMSGRKLLSATRIGFHLQAHADLHLFVCSACVCVCVRARPPLSV